MTTLSKNRYTSFTALLALFSLLFIAPLATAESSAIEKMANIVSQMNHFPSDEQKEMLSEISKNDEHSGATQTIAKAIHDIEHQPTEEHVAALEEIANDSEASEKEKQLAEIVKAFNHKASDEEKASLDNLTQN